jgi:hypothetical protein
MDLTFNGCQEIYEKLCNNSQNPPFPFKKLENQNGKTRPYNLPARLVYYATMKNKDRTR